MFIALGTGILVGALLMNIAYLSGLNFRIEQKARDMGMVYPEEIRIQIGEEGK